MENLAYYTDLTSGTTEDVLCNVCGTKTKFTAKENATQPLIIKRVDFKPDGKDVDQFKLKFKCPTCGQIILGETRNTYNKVSS